MTTAANVQAEPQVLYVAVDLGERPELSSFSQQVAHLNSLAQYCSRLLRPKEVWLLRPGGRWSVAETPEDVEELPDEIVIETADDGTYTYLNPRASKIRVLRTSLASPWVSILTDIAKSSAPVAYGIGGLYALQKLLQMIMEWQNHRQTLKERQQTTPPQITSGQEAQQVLDRHRAALIAQGEEFTSIGAGPIDSVMGLDKVTAAELISPDDPRASGTV